MLVYLLDIVPVAASRPRVTRFATFYSKSYTKYRNEIKELVEAVRFVKMEGPIEMEIIFNMPIPKSTSKKKALLLDGEPHLKKPDIDNLIKGVMDAINGVAYHDDSQVYNLRSTKVYSSKPNIVVKMNGVPCH